MPKRTPKQTTTMKRRFDKIDSLLDVEPTSVGRSSRIILKDEAGKHITLATAKGLTPSGKRYYEKAGKTYNASFDHENDLVRKGAREFVSMRDGS